MRNKTLDFDLDDTDDNGLVTIAAIAGAGALTLNGALVTGGVGVMDFARRIAFISAGDDSGDTMTIVGTDANGIALTEVLTMANAGTAESTGYFLTVTSLTASGASAGNVTIGTADEISSKTIPIDARSDSACTIIADITGTIDYTIQETFDSNFREDLQDAVWYTITAFSGKTADVNGSSTVGAKALRLIVNSFTNGAEVQVKLSQPLGC